jgi:hypothetical protein
VLWRYWSEQWELEEKVSFDGDTKSIYIHDDVTDFDIRVDLWSAWVRWRSMGNDHFEEAMRRTGFDLLPGSERTGDSYFLINGWKLFVDLETVQIKGVLFSDDYDTAYYSIETGNAVFPAKVSSLVNTVIQGGVGTLSEVAQAVWNADHSGYNQEGTTGELLNNIPVNVRTEMDSNSVKLAQIKAILDSMIIPSANDVSDAVWSAPINNHTTVGTFGHFIQKKILTLAKYIGLK